MRTVIIAVAVATPCLAQGNAGATDARDVSHILTPIIAEHKVPGMAAAIVQGWATTHIGAAGVRKAGEKQKVTAADKWHLGSDTKAMTATLCGVLVDEGTLRWNQTLGETFPDIAMDDAWKAVTLELLLTNRAGAPAGMDRDGLWGRLWNFKGTPMEARRALTEGVLKHPPEDAPGAKFIYSNAGFAIAGHMAEKVSGTAWEELMVRKVFDPLQMFAVGFGPPGTKGALDQPRGHRSNGKAVEPGPGADNPVAIGPAGTVHSSIGDWAKFIALHLRGDPRAKGGPESRLIRADTMAKLHAPGAGEGTKYAMGWIVTSRPWGGEGVLTHAGSNTMWYCTTWVAPERDLAVLIACNQGGDEAVKACDKAAAMLIREVGK